MPGRAGLGLDAVTGLGPHLHPLHHPTHPATTTRQVGTLLQDMIGPAIGMRAQSMVDVQGHELDRFTPLRQVARQGGCKVRWEFGPAALPCDAEESVEAAIVCALAVGHVEVTKRQENLPLLRLIG